MNEAQALASQKDFDKLDLNLRTVIDQLAQGQWKLMETMANESSVIQTHVTAEVSKSQDMLAQQIGTQAEETRARVSQSLSNLHLSAATEARREKLLRSLKYLDMNQRENMVQESFKDTFKWIFSPDLVDWDSFTAWLGSDEKLYWISGKPGSGKSTLMKFISGEEKTREFLKPGTVVLSHYLWAPGSPMQKSIRGVLQALLYQLLLEECSLVDLLLKAVKGVDRKDHDSDWSLPELNSSLKMTLSSSARPTCILLDGLDEVSPSDGPFELMDLIEEISNIPRVKICVASRPEPAYQKRYLQCPKLRLQDLTRGDIEKVCRDCLKFLEGDIPEKWGRSRPRDDPFEDFVANLTEKAEGVFLWVHLALKSIQRGYSNSDSWGEIQKRIHNIPAGLDKLYLSMWERANVDEGIYEDSASVYLNLVLEAKKKRLGLSMRGSLSVFGLMVASEPSVQAAILDGQGQRPTPDNLKKRCYSLMKKIESRCAGLIEFNRMVYDSEYMLEPGEWDALVPLTELEAAFVHRTAFDFLTETQGGRDILERDATSEGDRLVKLLRGLITQYAMWTNMKLVNGKPLPGGSVGKLEPDIDEFIYILISIGSCMPTISESTAETLLHSCETIWNAKLPRLEADAPGAQLPDFLGHVAGIGLYGFVRNRVEESERSAGRKVSQAYRDYLLHRASTDDEPLVPERKHLLVRWLLQEKANPSSAWFDASLNLFAYPSAVWLSTAIMNMIVSGIMELRRLENDVIALERTRQSCTTIQQILMTGPAMDHKTALEFHFHPNIGGSVPFILFLSFCVFPSPDEHRSILEVNTLFLLQLYVDMIRGRWPRIKDTDELLSWTLRQHPSRVWDGDTKPSVRLASYKLPNDDGLYELQPISMCYLDADLVRLLLVRILEHDETEDEKAGEELLSLITKTGRSVGTVLQRDTDEVFQEYAFFSWPAPEKHAREFPPPMFESEKESDNAGGTALGKEA